MTENRRSTPDLVGPIIMVAAATAIVLWAAFTNHVVAGFIALGCVPVLFWVIRRAAQDQRARQVVTENKNQTLEEAEAFGLTLAVPYHEATRALLMFSVALRMAGATPE